MQEVVYPHLQAKQLEFMNSKAMFRLYGGAKGGGKSYAMRAECVRQALSHEWVRGLALRRTTPEIKENMVVPMKKELPQWSYQYNGSDNIMTFPNGSTIRFSYCRNFDDVLQYQGVEYDFICIEELTHWTEEEFDILVTSLRTARSDIIPNFFGSTNPGGIGHAWVKRRWIDRQFYDWEDPDQYEFIPARVWDNQVLLDTMPQYVKTLENLPELDKRAYMDGDWDVFKGQYFKNFRREIHICEPFIPTKPKRRIIALDYGYTAPSAVYWIAQDTQGEITVYRELYETELTYNQLAVKIKAMTPENEKVEALIPDPAISKKSESNGMRGTDDFSKRGFRIKLANNNRVQWWQKVREYLEPYTDPNTKQTKAKLNITENCQNLIRTLPLMVHDQTNVEDLNTKTEDHAVDALRYGIMELAWEKSGFGETDKFNQELQKSGRDSASILGKKF